MRTSVDLLAKGYEVFISLSPDGSCDLIALKNGKCLRIEVRTSHYASDGQVYLHVSPRDKGRQDHYAAVLPDKILYFPDLSSCI